MISGGDSDSPSVRKGVVAGLDSRIKPIKRKACGYRNEEHFKASIQLFCCGVELYPTGSSPSSLRKRGNSLSLVNVTLTLP